jgi:hypothetical protein
MSTAFASILFFCVVSTWAQQPPTNVYISPSGSSSNSGLSPSSPLQTVSDAFALLMQFPTIQINVAQGKYSWSTSLRVPEDQVVTMACERNNTANACLFVAMPTVSPMLTLGGRVVSATDAVFTMIDIDVVQCGTFVSMGNNALVSIDGGSLQCSNVAFTMGPRIGGVDLSVNRTRIDAPLLINGDVFNADLFFTNMVLSSTAFDSKQAPLIDLTKSNETLLMIDTVTLRDARVFKFVDMGQLYVSELLITNLTITNVTFTSDSLISASASAQLAINDSYAMAVRGGSTNSVAVVANPYIGGPSWPVWTMDNFLVVKSNVSAFAASNGVALKVTHSTFVDINTGGQSLGGAFSCTDSRLSLNSVVIAYNVAGAGAAGYCTKTCNLTANAVTQGNNAEKSSVGDCF